MARIASEVARRRTRAGDVALALSIARLGVLLVASGGLLLPIFGLWLVHLGHWGYGSGWVDGALGLYVLAMLLGGELTALLEDRMSRAVNLASLCAVTAILALMVFKP